MTSKLLALLSLLFLASCTNESFVELAVSEEESHRKEDANASSRVAALPSSTPVLVSNSPAKLGSTALLENLPTLTPELREALQTQRKLLKRQPVRKTWTIDGVVYSRQNFIQVIDDLLSGRFYNDPLEGVEIASGGEVHFTAYYSPEIEVSSKKTKKFRYPIYAFPDSISGKLPSRYEIEREGALNGKAKVLAWASHVLDVYTLQLQGSGFVRFENGERRYLAYDGTNRYPYQSIEQALARLDSSVTDLSLRGLRSWVSEDPERRDTITTFNPNYGFFSLSSGKARGAAGIPLTPMVSVAADPSHYPLGAVLIANVPRVNKPGVYDTRLLLVQDTGGAVKGSKHLDLYTGVGKDALDIAERIYEYGEVYLLSSR